MEIQIKPIDQLLERVLCMNILSSDYFKELYRLKTYHEVIDEIYNQVDHVEPWMTGNCRGPSTAFCLLYKFFTMKLTSKQMNGLVTHQDSPYIRAVGFLYLRYAADPKTLWGWYEPYIKDDERFYTTRNDSRRSILYNETTDLGQHTLHGLATVGHHTRRQHDPDADTVYGSDPPLSSPDTAFEKVKRKEMKKGKKMYTNCISCHLDEASCLTDLRRSRRN